METVGFGQCLDFIKQCNVQFKGTNSFSYNKVY
jgi:hypothetical protein